MAEPMPPLEAIAAGLCSAIEQRNLPSVRQQIQVARIPPEAIIEKAYAIRGSRCMTALHYAVEDTSRDGLEMLRILLRELKMMNKKPAPLSEMLDTLGEGEVKIQGEEYPVDESYTPLAWACLHANVNAVKELLRQGADVNSQASQGKLTALMVACARMAEDREKEASQVITHLINDTRTSLDLMDDERNRAFHFYFQHKPSPDYKLLRKLVGGIDVASATNIHGWSALHLCARYCRGLRSSGTFAMLAQDSPCVELTDNRGLTAWDVARLVDNESCVPSQHRFEGYVSRTQDQKEYLKDLGLYTGPLMPKRGQPYRIRGRTRQPSRRVIRPSPVTPKSMERKRTPPEKLQPIPREIHQREKTRGLG
ncbi:MAG: hypothetical protein M1814_004976 [Vezdaea aestivalis]|nr:MAG: hypothetical protein M1814_004976 [Vezdaea aestivalis]